ncbi:MAG TPA: alpha/beta hydrolase [Actinomycetota bacterium]|nr:alpha/beta hydrolase [Actinomycetota bacterium]
MAEPLRPDGIALPIGDVVLYTPGLAGTAEIHQPGAPGMRAAEDTAAGFLEALAAGGLEEQLTVEIDDPTELDDAGGSRAAGGASEIVLEAPAPGTGFAQVLLYTAEDGSLSWHLPDDIPAEPAAVAARGGERRTFRVPRAVVAADTGGADRGIIGALGKKLLKLLVFPLVDPLVGAVAERYAGRWEQRHRRNRVRVFGPDDYRDPNARSLQPEDWARLSRGRALLFLHGSMSQSHTGFATLPQPLVRALHEHYDGRVAAFDHHTISVTPTDNARTLASMIPGDLRFSFDVIAHSRGGLLARVLSEHAGDVGLTDRLNVQTLVMVATPNAGTAIAEPKRLGKLMDRVTNIIQFLPDSPVLGTIDAVLTVIKQLAVGAFDGLTGLTAMDPHGPYLRDFLNQPAKTIATYRAVAANYEPAAGSPLLRIARDGVMDIVFGSAQNDLIVPTQGVFTVPGADHFPIERPLVFDSSKGVDHSGFWPRAEFGTTLRGWLGVT